MPDSKHFKDLNEILNKWSSTVIQDTCTTIDSSHDQDIYNCDITPTPNTQAIRITPDIPIADVLETTPTCSRQQETSSTYRRICLVKQDHYYEDSSKTLQTKYKIQKNKVKMIQDQVRVHKQRIVWLKRRIATLKDIVSELKKNRIISETGLACLDSIFNSDISLFLKRFMKNENNNNVKNTRIKKKQWKCQHRNPKIGISREKYPLALRSFAMTLHFYSSRAYNFYLAKILLCLARTKYLKVLVLLH